MRFAACIIVPAILSLAACGWGKDPFADGKYYSDDRPPEDYERIRNVADAKPRVEPKSKQGNPSSYEVFGKRYYVMRDSRGYVERGIASWYGTKFDGRKTSNGEIYDINKMTAAHKTLPLPTYVEVENLKTGKSVIVRVNDRGPFKAGRIIDLSFAAAQKLGISSEGTGLVEVRAIDPRAWRQDRPPPPPAVPQQPAAPPPVTRIYLQLGAFAQRHNAEALRVRASATDGRAFVVAETRNGAALYKVRIGPLATVEAVDAVMQRLIAHGFDEIYPLITD